MASRWATWPSSRSVWRYQCDDPSASEICRKPNSPASGFGASANQPSIAGSSVRWMFADRDTPLVSASRCRSAALGSAYPSAASCCWAEAGDSRASSAAELGHRAEQRTVEELLVQPAHLAAVPAPLLVELRDGLAHEAHRAAEPPQRPVVLGQHVGPAQLPQLHPVLERAQEPVGAVERGPVLPSDVPALGEVGQRGQRGGRPHGLVGATVHQLQQLYGELDVAQAARAELDLPLGVRGGDVRDHPAAHRLHVGDEAVALRGRPHHRRDAGAELLAQGEVAGDRTGLEQRLELPGLRPLLRSSPRGWPGCGPADRTCPRAAARRRPARSCPPRCGPSRSASGSRRAASRRGWPPARRAPRRPRPRRSRRRR